MLQYRVSPVAEADLEGILSWTLQTFGNQSRMRYYALISQAILDVADDPQRTGCLSRDILTAGASIYHLTHSRLHVPPASGRVKRPRHFLLFRIVDDGVLEIGRILHDSVELAQHIPQGYSAADPDAD